MSWLTEPEFAAFRPSSALHQERRNLSVQNQNLSLTICLKNVSTFVYHGKSKRSPQFLPCLSIYFIWHIMSDYVCGSQQLPPWRPNSKVTWGRARLGTWGRARLGSKGPCTFSLATAKGPGKGAWPGFPSNPWSGWRKEKMSWANQIWPSQQLKLEKRKEKVTEERPQWAR